MLELSEAQLKEINELEQRDFVRRVRDDLVAQFPRFASDPGLLERLEKAHEAAIAFGIHDGELRVQFIEEEAWHPGLYRLGVTKVWLTKKGCYSPEQRWKDMRAMLLYWTLGED